jgi:hypothetical protein
MAKDPEGTSFDRTVLPLPDPPFRGRIEEALKDSTPDFRSRCGRRRVHRMC